jgi:tRNA A37 methylthiotransferase MiaB
MKKLYVLSTGQGCLTNLQETTNVRKSLVAANYGGSFENSNGPEEADVIVVNTCGYNDTAEAESVKAIVDLKKKYPSKQIIVGGCLPKINLGKVQEIHSGQIIASGEWDKLPQILGISNAFVESTAGAATPLDEADLKTRLKANRLGDRAASVFLKFEKLLGRELQPVHNILKSLAFDAQTYVISVGTGCLGHCTYCAIKNAKGRLVSRPLAVIVDDMKKGLAAGFKRFHLVGDDVGCWGQDLGLSSAILLKEILKLPES